MKLKNQHYYSEYPNSKVRIFNISESLRRHLYIFKTLPGVFSFKKIDLGTKVFIGNMVIPVDHSVLLDLGCGYGPIGIVLGYLLPESIIYFIDINKRAAWCTKENIKINLPYIKKQYKTLSGNYLEPIKDKHLKFDGIFMNPPLRQGRQEFLELCNEIPKYIKPNGFFQFVIKKKMGSRFILNYLNNTLSCKKIEILCKRSGYWVFFIVFN